MEKEIGNFRFTETYIDGVFIIESKKYGDSRGYFEEVYQKECFEEAGIRYDFVQDNQSRSKKNVLRGLHYQKEHPQTKLVRCIEGSVFDVCVDLREGSPTFGRWFGVILSADKCNQLLIPRGFAHGFEVISDFATINYKVDDYYHPEDEGGIIWNDPILGINWPRIRNVILSEKDKDNSSFDKFLEDKCR